MKFIKNVGHQYSNINISGTGNVILGDYIADGTSYSNRLALAKGKISRDYSHKALRPVAYHVGRPALQARLKSELHDNISRREASAKIVVICGLGGTGKTQLARHYVQEFNKDYSSIYWVEAGSKEALHRDLMYVYRLVTGDQHELQLEFAVQAVRNWSPPKGKKCLFVFDEADAIDDEQAEDYVDIADFLPTNAGIDIILTTRSRSAQSLTKVDLVDVEVLLHDEAIELLLRSAKLSDRSDRTVQDASAIVEELGCLALAVTLAGSYIASTPTVCVGTYLAVYQQRRTQLLSRKPKQCFDQYDRSILTVWETSLQAITNRCGSAAGCLHLLSFLASDDIPSKMLQMIVAQCSGDTGIWTIGDPLSGLAMTEANLDDVTAELVNYSLLYWNEVTRSFSMHKLVHEWAHDRMSSDEQVAHMRAALRYLSQIITSSYYPARLGSEAIPHIMAAFSRITRLNKHTPCVNEEILDLLTKFGSYLDDSGHHFEQLDVYEFKGECVTALYGENDRRFVVARKEIAKSLVRKGWLAQAEAIVPGLIRLSENLLGKNDPETYDCVEALAHIYMSQRRLDEAEVLWKTVYDWQTESFGRNHLKTLQVRLYLTTNYLSQGQVEAARDLHSGLHLNEVVIQHAYLLYHYEMNAMQLQEQLNDKDGAIIAIDRLLGVAISTVGEGHPQVLFARRHRVGLLVQTGRLKEAKIEFEALVEAFSRSVGAQHRWTLSCMAHLAAICIRECRFRQAKKLRMMVVAGMSAIDGADNPELKQFIDNLDAWSWTQKHYMRRWLGLPLPECKRRQVDVATWT